jgi:hypothetical protein
VDELDEAQRPQPKKHAGELGAPCGSAAADDED